MGHVHRCPEEKMRIGIYFTPSQNQGGVYTYSVAILEALAHITGHRYVIISTSPDVPAKFLNHRNFSLVNLHSRTREISLKTRDLISYTLARVAPWLTQLLYRLRLYHLLTPIYRLTMIAQIGAVEEQNLDLIFYPTSSNLSFLAHTPAIVTVHDLQHRLNPRFPEVSAGGRWEHREYGFTNINRHAFRVLVDSEIGKEDWLNFYPTNPDRVVCMSYLPPSGLKTKISAQILKPIVKKLKLPSHFIYYPAKFWPHKNHLNLLKSLVLLRRQGKRVHLVLTGSKDADFTSYPAVENFIKQNKISDQIHYLGFVTNDELSALYKLAEALIMPTYFGPTNIPVLEAWVMGTPVITSDIRGCRDQLGDAGLLAHPDKPKEIAAAIAKIYLNRKLRQKLALKGRHRVRLWTQSDFTDRIGAIIKDFVKTRSDNRNG